MAVYEIRDAKGNYLNRVVADLDFVKDNFNYFEEVDSALDDNEYTAKAEARNWRNRELINTDLIASVADHPEHFAYLSYRTALRNWPSTVDFPNKKPTLDSLDARSWRDSELTLTDQASQTPDWANRDNILKYRTALRDWPSTEDFPDKKPTLST